MITVEGCKKIIAQQPALEKLSLVCNVEHMSEEDEMTLADALEYVCSQKTVDTVKILFSASIDLVRIFQNNANTEKVNVYMYTHKEVPTRPIRVPSDKTFHEFYMTLSDESYHVVKDILPQCTTVMFTKERTYTIEEYDFRAIDPAKTTVYIHSADMKFVVHGSDCVRYVFCADSYLYGNDEQRIMDHYLAHPMRNLREFIVYTFEMHLAFRVGDFTLYKLIERLKSERYVFGSPSPTNIVPMLKHIHETHGICYTKLGLICNTVDMCIVGRMCQLLLNASDISLVTSNNELLFTQKMPDINCVNWTEVMLLEPEVQEIRKKTNVGELVHMFTRDANRFQWMALSLALNQQ